MPIARLSERLQGQRTVRPRSAGIPVLLCVLMFALTATVVNRLGRERWTPVNRQPTYTATAYAVDTQTGVRTPFTFTAADPQRAAETTNELAESYASDRVGQWRHAAERRQVKAHESAEKARLEHRESQGRLDAFKRQLSDAGRSQAQASSIRRQKPQPTMIENPRWADLNQRVSDLERRREQLLQDRTPQHPAVLELTSRLKDAQEQLAAVPRQIPGREPKAADAENPPALVPPRVDEATAAKNQRVLDELNAAVEKSGLALRHAERLQQLAAEQQHAGPQLVIENAKTVRNAPQVDYGWRRLLWTTFATSLLMAFGVGSVAAGARIEPPVASVEEVTSVLGKSVIGTMPAETPGLNSSTIRCQGQVRRATMAIGLIMIVTCPIVAIWGVMGI
jgi:hypothetical protein